jgi:hypothetical protein
MSLVRKLKANQVCQVHVFDVVSGEDRVIYSTEILLLEAPNWHKDGYLIPNGNGVLWKLNVETPTGLQQIVVNVVPDLNNDHVLSPDHESIYMSAYDDWQIYRVPLAGGRALRVSPAADNTFYFLHGVNGDESELAYVNIRGDAENVFSSGRIHLLNWRTVADRVLVNGAGP